MREVNKVREALYHLTELINPQYIIIFGGIVTLLGTYLAWLQNDINTTRTGKSIFEIGVQTKEINMLTKELGKKQLQIEELQDKNLKLSNSISDKALEIADYVSSKDSYAYIIPYPPYGESAKNPNLRTISNIIIWGLGAHAIKIYGIDIIAKDKLFLVPHKRMQEVVLPNKFVQYTLDWFYQFVVPATIKWDITLQTSNGTLKEDLEIYYEKNGKYWKKIIVTNENGETIYSHFDPEFNSHQ